MEFPIRVKPIPVLPAVPSTIIPFSLRIFFSSESFIIAQAALSFIDPPGFKYSAFPKILQPVSFEGPFSLINGVLPIASIKLL
ncbi:uncharacterized protein METZ01_LOCUS327014 [marine metagenome]|uniref:Uncharacterized protein n=1 Tax=marine metagenome TaxID=408172 RepID=A0A382PN23_9ZZZZ